MRKSTIFTAFMVCVFVVFSSSAFAADSDTNYKDLKSLQDALSQKSPDINSFNVGEDSNYRENNQSLKDIDKSINDIKDNVKDLNDSIKDINDNLKKLAKQQVDLQKSIELLKLAQNQSSRKKENKVLLEKYLFQKDYYAICLLNEQKASLEKDLEIAGDAITSEQEKARLDLSTNINVSDAEYRKKQIADGIETLKNNIDLALAALRLKLDMEPDDDFAPKFILPSVASPSAKYDLAALTARYIEKNLDLEAIDAGIKTQTTYIEKLSALYNDNDNELAAAKSDLKKMLLNRTSLKRSLTLYVKQSYYQYKQAIAALLTKIDSKSILQRKLNVLEAEYKEGKYSNLQYKAQMQDLRKPLLDVDRAVVDYLNAEALMELIGNGIRG